MIAPSFSEAMQRGWTAQEWQMACQQEQIEQENAEDEEGLILDDSLGGYGEMSGDDEYGEVDGIQQYFPGQDDPDVLCMCPGCQRQRSQV